ncbi:MAG: hypothetical protein E5299_01480 [Burkholderia gladioli]|nr:MAG: hypothetical protein E5299_01480 [Burkholderia gladioli]
MYRFKTLTGNCLWARHIDSQATKVAVCGGVINRIADLARPQSVRIACNYFVDATASSRSIMQQRPTRGMYALGVEMVTSHMLDACRTDPSTRRGFFSRSC